MREIILCDKDAISNERLLVTHILDNTVDDLLPMLSDKDREYVEHYQHYFHQAFKYMQDMVNNHLAHQRAEHGFERKSFATTSYPTNSILSNKIVRQLIFKGWDSGYLPYEEFTKVFRAYLTSNGKFRELKETTNDYFLWPEF